jgi:hypothetical protein
LKGALSKRIDYLLVRNADFDVHRFDRVGIVGRQQAYRVGIYDCLLDVLKNNRLASRMLLMVSDLITAEWFTHLITLDWLLICCFGNAQQHIRKKLLN